MVKRVMSLIMAVVLAMSMLMLMGCDKAEKRLQDKIDELEALIDAQGNQIAELENRNAEQEDRINELEGSIKLAAIAEIESYAKEKGEENYSLEKWATINWHVNEFKTKIMSIEESDEIEFEIEEAKKKIDYVITLYEENALTYASWADNRSSTINPELLEGEEEKTFIITNSEEYSALFTDTTSFVNNFEDKIMFLHIFKSRDDEDVCYCIRNLTLESGNLKIYFGKRSDPARGPEPPFILRSMIVVMYKIDIETVEFIRVSYQ